MKYIPVIHHRTAGFTLVEMAMVLLIISLLLGGLLPTISSQIEQRRMSETRQQLEEIKEALTGYAISRSHLPCPAKSASDGSEDRNAVTGTCNKRVGFLPWAELGVAKTDGWGRIFLYSASNNFTNSTTPFTLTSSRDITIQTRNPAGTLINLSNSNDIPAAVVSTGINGIFGTLDNGTVISSNAPSSNNDNDQKTNANVTGSGILFISRDPAAAINTSDVAFDDLLIWISPNALFNRMVAAGKLP